MEMGGVVAGRYELLERVGGSSWRALDRELRREVLLRMPAAGLGAAGLSHPSIVQLFDQGDHEGVSYAVLEYVSGGTLADRLDAGAVDAGAARRIAADVTAALAYAHAQGVTHGALSPANVLLDAEGNAKVAGLGGAGAADQDRAALASLLELLDVGNEAPVEDDADVTAVLAPVPAGSPRRRPVAPIALGALALLLAGVGAAFLWSSGGSGADVGTGTGPAESPISTGSGTQSPATPSPTTTTAPTTEPTTTGVSAPAATVRPTTTEPATTAPPPVTEPPETTAPPPTTEPPAPTTAPPPTTEPPAPTTEPPPPTTG